MNIFVTSDHHFSHTGILKLCQRPFMDVDEMNFMMVRYWNEVVEKNDVVYHLGDFTLSGEKVAKYFVQQLNGKIKILGMPWHHDKRWLEYAPDMKSRSGYAVEVLPPMVVLQESGTTFHLSHYPLTDWEQMYRGGIQLHGHTHGNYVSQQQRIMDVGVDCVGFAPIDLESVVSKLVV